MDCNTHVLNYYVDSCIIDFIQDIENSEFASERGDTGQGQLPTHVAPYHFYVSFHQSMEGETQLSLAVENIYILGILGDLLNRPQHIHVCTLCIGHH